MQDGSNADGHYQYLYWLMIQPTGQAGLEFVSLSDMYAAAYSWADSNTATITWNGSFITSFDPYSRQVTFSAPDSAAWGTYTYDVVVQKIDPSDPYNPYQVVDQILL